MSEHETDLTIAIPDTQRSVVVSASELRYSFSPSGGPGGQHANRAHSRVELRLDLGQSAAFTATERRRLRERFGDEIRVVADERRSQHQNRQAARERLAELLARALRPRRRRRPTKPTKGSQRRRVDAKRRRSETKRGRQRPRFDD